MYINTEYKKLLNTIYEAGEKQVCRNYSTIEVLNCMTEVPMVKPLVTLSKRKLGYKFAVAEAVWITSGDNKVATIAPYASMISKFSDDGQFFFGAYGPKIIDQIPYIGQCFKKDLYSRQAVINIWREKPPVSNDIPCTLSLQFIMRKGENGKLYMHIIDTMRSSDAWLGVPYDWFSLSMVGVYVTLYIRSLLKVDVYPGIFTLNAGSQHLYEGGFNYNIDKVKEAMADDEELFEYAPLDINEFNDHHDFLFHMSLLMSGHEEAIEHKWLTELIPYWENK